ncbi:MAG: ATP-binding protein [Acidimicrobiales bacterium]
MSVRIRLTLVAVLVTAPVLALAAYALGWVLSDSLLDEVDTTIFNRAFDVADGIDLSDELSNASFPGDEETFVGVIEFGDAPVLEIHNDVSPDPNEILDALSDPTGAILVGEPVDASLDSLSLVVGADNMRLVAADLQTGDELVVVARTLDGLDRTTSRVDRLAFGSVPVLSGLAGLLAWVLAGRALKPVERMRSQVADIAESDLDRRVAVPETRDEVARLGRTMNSMLDRLSAARQRERRFSADVAHELRSPLSVMAAQLDVDNAHLGVADWQATAAVLTNETDRMRRMVDDLLALARLDAVPADRPSSPVVDLDDVVFDAAAAVSTRGVMVDVGSVAPAIVRGERDQLLRCVENLLANAVRHHDAAISCSLAEADGVVRLVVEDDGPGVPVAQRQAVFERFVRLDEARSREAGGAGLGLALVRELVEAHGGAVWVDESSLGGARFVIELPTAG